jgi:hypothetical protein
MDSTFAEKIRKHNTMKKEKAPLSKAERSEIWKSFWLHAIGAFGFAVATTIAANAGFMAESPILLRMVILGIPTFLVWARFVSKIEKFKDSTGIPYPSTYFVLAIASAIMLIGPLVLFVSLLIRLHNVPWTVQTADQSV